MTSRSGTTVAGRPPPVAALPPGAGRAVEGRNARDRALYEYAAARFEQQVAQLGPERPDAARTRPPARRRRVMTGVKRLSNHSGLHPFDSETQASSELLGHDRGAAGSSAVC